MASRTKDTKDIEVAEDLKFQRSEWKFQNAGVIALFTMLVLAVLGLFGDGLLNDAEVSAGSYRVEYKNIVRREELFETSIIIDDISGIKDSVIININHDFCRDLLVDFAMPQPLSYEITADSYNLVFLAKDAAAPIRIYLQMKHDKAGVKEARINIPGKGETMFNQIVLP